MLTCVLVTRSPGAGDKTIHPFTGDQSPDLSPVLSWQWLLSTDPSHLRTRPHSPAPPSELLLLLKSKSEFVGAQCLYWMAGRELRDPLAVAFLSADTVFVLPVFLSLSNSVLHSIHFLFFSSPPPPLFFGQRQKKVEQRGPSFRPNHSPTLGRMNCLLYISPVFSWNSGIPVSHTQLSM